MDMARTSHRWSVVIAAALVASLTACGRSRDAQPANAPPAPAATAATDEGSIYDLDVRLTDAAGRTLPLTDLRGHTIVAAMMYSSCTSICPRVTEDMKAVENQLVARGLDDVTFALFSLDPGRDTPAALRSFAGLHHLTSRWQLFAASEDDVRTLAAVIGVKFARQDDGEIAHSATIVVIDKAGVIRHRQVGLTDSPRELVEAVRGSQS